MRSFVGNAFLTVLFLLAIRGACMAETLPLMPSADKCNSLPNMEAADCLAAVAKELEPVLQQYYEAARAHIRKLAADEHGIGANDLKDALSSLERAQTSWRSYRAAQCDMVVELYTNGSGKTVSGAMCIINLTGLRIHELWEFGGFPALPEPK